MSRIVLLGALLCVLSRSVTAFAADAGANPLDSWSVAEGYSLSVFARGLDLPTGLALVPTPGTKPSSPKMFITELRGRIRVLANDGSLSDFASVETFAPGAEWPNFAGEAGLGSICLEPRHGYVFVTYAYRDAQGMLRNAMTRFSTTPGTFEGKPKDAKDFKDFFVGAAAAFSHQIGECIIDGDAVLVSVGDAGQPGASHDLDVPLGKILRFTLDGAPYPKNVFARETGARRAVYAYGLRNTFGLTLTAGRLFAAENGIALDRFLEVHPAIDHGWDGTDASIAMNAFAVFKPPIGPAHVAHVKPQQKVLEPSTLDRFVIAASNSVQGPGLVLLELDIEKHFVPRTPRYFVRFDGQQFGQGVTGVVSADEAIYFTPMLPVGDSGAILTTRYDPEHAHDHVIGQTPGDPIAARNCLGCHSLEGRGGVVGPALDRNSLTTRAETLVLDPSYGARVARLDAMTDPTMVAAKAARAEVVSAPTERRVRTWLINRIMNPRFDSPDAQMPNVGIPRPEAEIIADKLLGTSGAAQSTSAVHPGKRLLAKVTLGALLAAAAFVTVDYLRGRWKGQR